MHKGMKKYLTFNQNQEIALFILLRAQLNDNKNESILNYVLEVFNNIFEIDYQDGINTSANGRFRSIERIIYNLIAFVNRSIESISKNENEISDDNQKYIFEIVERLKMIYEDLILQMLSNSPLINNLREDKSPNNSIQRILMDGLLLQYPSADHLFGYLNLEQHFERFSKYISNFQSDNENGQNKLGVCWRIISLNFYMMLYNFESYQDETSITLKKMLSNTISTMAKLIRKNKVFQVMLNGIFALLTYTSENDFLSSRNKTLRSDEKVGQLVLRTTFDRVIKKKQFLTKTEVANIFNIITEFSKKTDFERSTLNIVLYSLKQIFKLEYLHKELYFRHKTMSAQLSYSNLHYIRDYTTHVLICSYKQEFTSFNDKEIERNLFFCSVSKLIDEVIAEEMTASHTLELNEKDINLALANFKGDSFTNLVIPIYNKLADLIVELCQEMSQVDYTNTAIELLEQKFQVKRLLQEYSMKENKHLKYYYLKIMKVFMNLALQTIPKDTENLNSFLRQVLMFVLKQRDSINADLDSGVDSVLSSIINRIAPIHLDLVLKIIINELYENKRTNNTFIEDEYMTSRTVLCLKWIQQIMIRSEANRNLRIADEIAQEETVTHMKLWCVIIMDYPMLAKLPDAMKIVKEIAVLSPPLIEMTQKYYTNTIVSFENFQEDNRKERKSFRHRIREFLKEILPDSYPDFQGLRLNNLTYVFAVAITLNAKIEEFDHLSIESYGKSYTMLLAILSYIDNYLLYSEDNIKIRTALESVIKGCSDKYITKLERMVNNRSQMIYSRIDFYILLQMVCSDCESFSQICKGLIHRYTRNFSPLFFSGDVLLTIRIIIDQILEILGSEYSLSSKTLDSPYYSLNIKLPTDTSLLTTRLTILTSALVRLYLRAYPINKFLCISAIEYAISNSLHYYKSTTSYGIKFLIMMSQATPSIQKTAALKATLVTLWIESKEKFDKKFVINFKCLPPLFYSLYYSLEKKFMFTSADFLKAIENVIVPETRYNEDFIGGIHLTQSQLKEKFNRFNHNCYLLEYSTLQIVSELKIDTVDIPKFLETIIRVNVGHNIVLEKKDYYMLQGLAKKQIADDFNFFLNLVHSESITQLAVFDNLVEILSMYREPSLYELFFANFIPGFIRNSKLTILNIMNILENLFKSLSEDLEITNLPNFYQNIEISQSIMDTRVPLFSTIFTNNSTISEAALIPSESNSKLSTLVDILSPSLSLKYPYRHMMEELTASCFGKILGFLDQILPIFFIIESDKTVIIKVLKLLMNIDPKSIYRIPLDIFCKYNETTLNFLMTLDNLIETSKRTLDNHQRNKSFLDSLLKSLVLFNYNYFGWSIYQPGKSKDNFKISLNSALMIYNQLTQIYQKILLISEMTDKIDFSIESFYSTMKPLKTSFVVFKQTYLTRHKDYYTLFRLSPSFSLSGSSYANNKIYVNALPEIGRTNQRDGDIQFNMVEAQKILSYFIADEIENIKACYFTNMMAMKNPYSMEMAEFNQDELEEYTLALAKVNALAGYSFFSRFKYTIRSKNNTVEIIRTSILGEFVLKNAELLLDRREYLEILVNTSYSKGILESQNSIFFWSMPHIPIILSFISTKYKDSRIMSDYFSKMMSRISPMQLAFYLNQIFQALEYTIAPKIESFLLKYSRRSQLLSHQLIWLSRVEKVAEVTEEKKKKNANFRTNENKIQYANNFENQIIEGMSMEEKDLWFAVDSFFNQITEISSMLSPKEDKSVKRSKINTFLEEIKLPKLLYLPTNPTMKILDISKGSGRPMQSAAKCPIMVGFICKKFEGPDEYFANNSKPLSIEFGDEEKINESFLRMSAIDEPSIKSLNSSSMINLHTHSYFNKNKFARPGLKDASRMINFPPQLGSSIKPQLNVTRRNEINSSSTNKNELEKLASQINPASLSINSVNRYGTIDIDDSIAFNTTMQNIPKKQNLKKNIPLRTITSTGDDQYGYENDEIETSVVSCIFKTHDDIRQDSLALQVIQLFKEIFQRCDLDLFVVPYKTISTRTGADFDIGGIIEVVPNSFSRDQIGKENRYNLTNFFKEKFGNELNPLFQAARENFVKSLAAYSIASYILQTKDRHNGNILIDDYGHLIHIDFGFIFDISPGGNMRFEAADFKLTQEMIDLMGGRKEAEPYKKYVDLVIRGFLAVRRYKEHFYYLIEQIYESGMECFNPKSMELLKLRFMDDMNDIAAANQMHKRIMKAHGNMRTFLYDHIQYMQQKIDY